MEETNYTELDWPVVRNRKLFVRMRRALVRGRGTHLVFARKFTP